MRMTHDVRPSPKDVRTHKTYETACTYLVVASQQKTDEATTFFDAVGEVASWLSAPDEHLLAFKAAKTKTAAWCRQDEACDSRDRV